MAKNNSNLRKADSAKNKNLHKAKNAKKDQFYTQLYDIEKQVFRYGVDMGHFKDKVILLPCDESQHTNFYKHFMEKREEYGWKKLIAVGYRENHPAEAHIIVVRKDGMQEKNEPLKGNGDFRNEETQKLFDECDVVVTNPPFSLFREFVDLLMKKDKKFLIIGNQNAITYKEIFPLIKQNKLWLGYGFAGGNAYFGLPEDADVSVYSKGVYNPETHQVKFRNCVWFTNMHITKRDYIYNTGIDFEHGSKMGWYQKYDNYDAINVNKTCQIPMDYNGVIGVPISFLDKYNPKQFEIVKFRKGDDEKDLRIGEKQPYFRILIKAKR